MDTDTAAHGDDTLEAPSPSSNVHIRPACENCRVRKLDRRMDQVLGLLHDLKNDRQPDRCSHAALPTRAAHVSTVPSSPSSQNIQQTPSAVLGVEGESSLAAHSAFASNLMHQVASAETSPGFGPDMRNTLDALSHVVGTLREQTFANEMAYPHSRPSQRPRPSGYELPPIEKAVELIRIAKSQRLAGTGFIYEFMFMRDFSDICLQVYFSDTFSEMEFIIANAGFYSLFTDYSYHVSAGQKDTYLGHARMCRENLETALYDLPLHLPTTPEAITALLFGAWHAIELSKPYLSWALSSKASELCQTLGYHRMPDTDNSDDAKFRKFLFWTNYFLDKSLCLRLGRASTIPDWDITTHRPAISDPHQEPVMAYFVLWIEAARCQGNIYELLYCPEAITQLEHVRHTRVQLLVNDLHMLEQATQETHKKWIQISRDNAGKDLMDFFAVSDDILRLSLLTLVYRAAPQQTGALTTFSPSCVEAARATLHRHHDCLEIIERSSQDFFPTYVHWTLLFAPFIPFIVIFCQVIETQDKEDLNRLRTFVASIQPAAAASSAATKLHRLFQVLYNVATRYVELSASRDVQPQDTEEMDTYLKLLGMQSSWGGDGNQQQGQGVDHDLDVTSGGDTNTIGPMLMNPMIRTGHGAQLEEWFYSNQALMQSFGTFPDRFSPAG
ncbi:Putative transcriptional regulatory protein C11D3.07c [Fusarium oxysporum f. sp. cubense race 1]|uniref:Putative transcriptional regulatory protein C11D3.07c n=1 Tax=Fusarium oxysporum f. sp. cubense (strain race 1) TaxID=1229664 RepID=N4U5S3_FUSC1|nr:Putative transcriptional regulatory protein C11D3.07c [Fusarium oxysporum f. sp. cubense race 1]